MTRRFLLSALAAAAADSERLLWTPGAKMISVPKPRPLVVMMDVGSEIARPGWEFVWTVIPPDRFLQGVPYSELKSRIGGAPLVTMVGRTVSMPAGFVGDNLPREMEGRKFVSLYLQNGDKINQFGQRVPGIPWKPYNPETWNNP